MVRLKTLATLFWLWLPAVAAHSQTVCMISVEGPIGPATANYISRCIEQASATNAQCLVIQLDTPGGLLDSTKVIVRELLASPVPVVVYVAPAGAGASSAGCFITLAADVAAMAPGTTIGAAHPVALGGDREAQLSDTMKQKLENYAVSYIESIASRRKRNVEWARASVRDSACIRAEQALEMNVIDLIAVDVGDLLRQLDGRRIAQRTLETASASIVRIPPSPREKFFQMFWRPEVMLILMMIAMYGIIGELSNPGAIFPGVAGVIALILALYMAAVLPVNLAGLALIVVAVLLFVADVFAPTHGVLTVGGVVAFFLGGLMMFDRAEPMLRISLALLIPASVLTGAFFLFVVGAGLRAQFLPPRVGLETLLGRTVPALTPIDAEGGKVFVEGEYWNAVSDTPVPRGTPVEIIGVEGLKLKVRVRAS